VTFALRAATAADHDRIDLVTHAAFAPLVAAGQAGGEAALVRRLRNDGDALWECVAVDDAGAVIGHVMFSRLRQEAGLSGAALAPVSVAPAHQRRGVGAALCRSGLDALRGVVDVVVVLGHPGYYPRLGFSAAWAAAHLRTPYDGEHLMACAFCEAPRAPVAVRYPAAFG
jgi:putative acetyltransferase